MSDGVPPVRHGLPGQRPHGSSPPRALLVGVVHRLRGGRPHRGRRPLRAAGAALQPLAEVSPSEGQQQLVARRWCRTLSAPSVGVEGGGQRGEGVSQTRLSKEMCFFFFKWKTDGRFTRCLSLCLHHSILALFSLFDSESFWTLIYDPLL